MRKRVRGLVMIVACQVMDPGSGKERMLLKTQTGEGDEHRARCERFAGTKYIFFLGTTLVCCHMDW